MRNKSEKSGKTGRGNGSVFISSCLECFMVLDVNVCVGWVHMEQFA